MPKQSAPARKASASAKKASPSKAAPKGKPPAKKPPAKPEPKAKAPAKAPPPKGKQPPAKTPPPKAAESKAAPASDPKKVVRKGITIVAPKPTKKASVKAAAIKMPHLGSPLIKPGSVVVATLTEKGARHLRRAIVIEGVKRPSRPGE